MQLCTSSSLAGEEVEGSPFDLCRGGLHEVISCFSEMAARNSAPSTSYLH